MKHRSCTAGRRLRRLLWHVALVLLAGSPSSASAQARSLEAIRLNEPNTKRGLPFMETLSVKASAQEWSDAELSLQDLSDLMWAANGMNRPDVKKYTASSAMNAHDVDLYVFMRDGIYLYDADRHVLNRILEGDCREQILRPLPPQSGDSLAPPQVQRPSPSKAPVQLVLVSDLSRFRAGTEELKREWGAIDAGIVSQNISLFCAATGLRTRPRASMDRDAIRKLLNLKESQHIFLHHPVGYAP